MSVILPTHCSPCPAVPQVRCVRADLATRVEFQVNSPALIFYPYKQRPALAGWIADERAATFVVQSHDGNPQPLEGYRLKEPDQIRREKLEREGLTDEHAGACVCMVWQLWSYAEMLTAHNAYSVRAGLSGGWLTPGKRAPSAACCYGYK